MVRGLGMGEGEEFYLETSARVGMAKTLERQQR
jgi:hypothetical protein